MHCRWPPLEDHRQRLDRRRTLSGRGGNRWLCEIRCHVAPRRHRTSERRRLADPTSVREPLPLLLLVLPPLPECCTLNLMYQCWEPAAAAAHGRAANASASPSEPAFALKRQGIAILPGNHASIECSRVPINSRWQGDDCRRALCRPGPARTSCLWHAGLSHAGARRATLEQGVRQEPTLQSSTAFSCCAQKRGENKTACANSALKQYRCTPGHAVCCRRSQRCGTRRCLLGAAARPALYSLANPVWLPSTALPGAASSERTLASGHCRYERVALGPTRTVLTQFNQKRRQQAKGWMLTARATRLRPGALLLCLSALICVSHARVSIWERVAGRVPSVAAAAARCPRSPGCSCI